MHIRDIINRDRFQCCCCCCQTALNLIHLFALFCLLATCVKVRLACVRYLFVCLKLQATKELSLRNLMSRTYTLRHRMLHFIQNFVYYITFEVKKNMSLSLSILYRLTKSDGRLGGTAALAYASWHSLVSILQVIEPRWYELEAALKRSKTVDEVVYYLVSINPQAQYSPLHIIYSFYFRSWTATVNSRILVWRNAYSPTRRVVHAPRTGHALNVSFVSHPIQYYF